MTLITRLEEELTESMKARDSERRDALRLILASLRSAEKDLQRPLTEGEELQVLQRERKKRVEAIDAFAAAGRSERAEREEFELGVLEELFARLREQNLFAHSVKKTTAQICFQRLHRMTNSGL